MNLSKEPRKIPEYLVERELGSGAMATVYEAYEPAMDRRVALKVMKRDLMGSPAAVQAFVDEARRTAALEHDHIPRVFKLGQVDGVPFLAMGLIRGVTLSKAIQQMGALSKDRLRALVVELGDALAFAHDRSVLHCDIKPGNVLLDHAHKAWLTDFGISHALGLDAVARSGPGMSSPRYASPEQLAHGQVSVRSDVYSLGLLLYEASTGKRPFAACDTREALDVAKTRPLSPLPSEVRRDLDRSFDTIVVAATSWAPELRPASVGEFVRRMLTALGPSTPQKAVEQGERLDPTQVGEDREGKRPRGKLPARGRARTAAMMLVFGAGIAAVMIAKSAVTPGATIGADAEQVVDDRRSDDPPTSRPESRTGAGSGSSFSRGSGPLSPSVLEQPPRLGLVVSVPGRDLEPLRIGVAARLAERLAETYPGLVGLPPCTAEAAFERDPKLDFVVEWTIHGRLEHAGGQGMPRFVLDRVKAGVTSRVRMLTPETAEVVPKLVGRAAFDPRAVEESVLACHPALTTVWKRLEAELDIWRTHGRPRLLHVVCRPDRRLEHLQRALAEVGRLEPAGSGRESRVVLAAFGLALDDRAPLHVRRATSPELEGEAAPRLVVHDFVLYSGRNRLATQSALGALVVPPFVCAERDGAFLLELGPES